MGIERTVALAVFLVALAGSSWEFPEGSDGRAMLATSESLILHGTLAIDGRFAHDDAFAPSARAGRGGRVYAKYGLGLPLLESAFLVPALVVHRAAGVDRARAIAVALSLMNPLLTALAALGIARLCRAAGASPPAAAGVGAVYALATPALAYATTDGTEPLVAALVTLVALAVVRGAVSGWDRWPGVAGLGLGALVLTKSTTIVLVPALAAAAVLIDDAARAGVDPRGRWHRVVGRAVVLFGPATLVVGFIAGLNWWRFGSITQSGYNSPVLTNPLAAGLYGLLLSPNKGLLFYAPFTVLAPAGLWRLWRGHPALATVASVATATWVVLHALFYDWGGGWCWGPRYLVPVLPLLVACAAAGAAGRGRTLGGTLAAAGLAVSLLGVVISEDAYRRTTMNVWMPEVTGTVPTGAADGSGTLVKMPVPPEDVVPSFSSIAGHWWLARLALAGCDCVQRGVRCGCTRGTFEEALTAVPPPWIGTYPGAAPQAPIGTSLIRPRLLRELHFALLGPARPAAATSSTVRFDVGASARLGVPRAARQPSRSRRAGSDSLGVSAEATESRSG